MSVMQPFSLKLTRHGVIVKPELLKQLQDSIIRLTPQEGMNETAFPGIYTYRSTVEVTQQLITYPASLVILAQGRKACHFANQSFTYQQGQMLFVASEMTVSCHNYASPAEPLLEQWS